MTLKDLSKQAGMNYNTTRKYYMVLQENGLAKSPDSGLIPILQEIARLSSEGKTVKQAVEIIKTHGISRESDEMRSLRTEVSELKKEVRSLSELLQLELRNLQEVRALPETVDQLSKLRHDVLTLSSKLESKQEQAGFWFHVKTAFSSLFRRK